MSKEKVKGKRMNIWQDFQINDNKCYIRQIGPLEILKDIAEKNHFILDEPEPFIMFDGFGSSAMEITFGAWFVRDDRAKAKTGIMIDIKERFDREGIEIPFPHVMLYAGSNTGPVPVDIHSAQ